ncbi:hypothetical protein O181_006599 [Austropuccinia psidii MF-1]|uniref:Uncharacterized protein n=1 Tax=Austropuccinia psidii MF-1 TaxID=1389203 RepID=A0A9Q3GH17_9BASI|nr:hypothetical protein [Austropuccinia psidii MF-1]
MSVWSSQVVSIPEWPSRNPIDPLIPTIPGDLSAATHGPPSEPIKTTDIEFSDPPHETRSTLFSPSHIPLPQKKDYTYVPHYHNALKDINSSISQDHIVRNSR